MVETIALSRVYKAFSNRKFENFLPAIESDAFIELLSEAYFVV